MLIPKGTIAVEVEGDGVTATGEGDGLNVGVTLVEVALGEAVGVNDGEATIDTADDGTGLGLTDGLAIGVTLTSKPSQPLRKPMHNNAHKILIVVTSPLMVW